jgi:Na+/glutamate symporter
MEDMMHKMSRGDKLYIIVICLMINVIISLITFVLWAQLGPEWSMGFVVAVVISSVIVSLSIEVVRVP